MEALGLKARNLGAMFSGSDHTQSAATNPKRQDAASTSVPHFALDKPIGRPQASQERVWSSLFIISLFLGK